MTDFWAIPLCNVVEVEWRFRRAYYHHDRPVDGGNTHLKRRSTYRRPHGAISQNASCTSLQVFSTTLCLTHPQHYRITLGWETTGSINARKNRSPIFLPPCQVLHSPQQSSSSSSRSYIPMWGQAHVLVGLIISKLSYPLKSRTKLLHDWRPVSPFVLVSSPFLAFLPRFYLCLPIIPDSFTRALWQSFTRSHLIAKQEKHGEVVEFCLRSISFMLVGLLTYRLKTRRRRRKRERRESGGKVVRDTTLNKGKTELSLRLWRSPGSARSSSWYRREDIRMWRNHLNNT
jgi:hypothetical protein